GAGASLFAGSDSRNRLHTILVAGTYAIITMAREFRHSPLTTRTPRAARTRACRRSRHQFLLSSSAPALLVVAITLPVERSTRCIMRQARHFTETLPLAGGSSATQVCR